MAKFSVGRDEEDREVGSSSRPKSKKQRIEAGEEESIEDGESVAKELSSGIPMVLSDPDVLDCKICFEPLAPPVFQCESGHIACSSCCTKIRNKCPFCSWPIGYNRCLAIEKVIESIKVSCQHAEYGCRETLSYNQKFKHEEACIYAPCKCPIADCIFGGSSEQLSVHFSNQHSSSARNFRYNCPFSVSFDKNEPFLIFQEEEDGRLFLLNNRSEHIGNSIMVTSIGTRSSNGGFFYDVLSRRGCSSLRFQSFTKFVKRQQEASYATDFLLVPCDFVICNGHLKLEVCIQSS